MTKQVLMALIALTIFVSSASAQDYSFGLGEHDFQVNANNWVKIKFPTTSYNIYPTSSEVIRIRYDDGQEFQMLPQPKEFRQRNSQTIQTKWLKVSKGENVPVDDLGKMPNAILYLKAESGVANVHLSVTQPVNNPSSQGQQQGNTQNSGGLGSVLSNIIVWGLILYGGVKVAKYGIKTKCPSCSKWWSRKIKQTLINPREGRRTVTQYDTHYDVYGNEIGSTGRNVEVPDGMRGDYEELRECSRCHHQWTIIGKRNISYDIIGKANNS